MFLYNISDHKFAKHAIKPVDTKGNALPVYVCEECGYQTMRKRAIEEHKHTHTGKMCNYIGQKKHF